MRTPVGAPGEDGPRVMVLERPAEEVPLAFVAVTSKVYDLPAVRPVA